ncbi:hypothetical protein EJ02DRAFT_432624 [Clathrospora elynae]|uniref:2EXR domain-containing protein n=1 Tax=Clathrospora elynae TaxID=706981 RepID=A0A6A5T4R6_9PLEO|nr:hypothetical protein EJ02DRAFT_432624 [Clathrospora elynae]
MAPRKAPKAKKAPTLKKSADKVVKRPARGFHKFRNGLLNVTPKGGEKVITKSNQNSPLLRLPPEIRNQVWELVLGGEVFRAVFTPSNLHTKYKLTSSPAEPTKEMALLRTCRQIYAEAAMMPLILNKFSFECVFEAKYVLSKLKTHQRKHIAHLQFELSRPSRVSVLARSDFHRFRFPLPGYLPGLKELRVCIFSVSATDETARGENERQVRKKLEPHTQGTSIELNVEQTEFDWESYHHSWRGNKSETYPAV